MMRFDTNYTKLCVLRLPHFKEPKTADFGKVSNCQKLRANSIHFSYKKAPYKAL